MATSGTTAFMEGRGGEAIHSDREKCVVMRGATDTQGGAAITLSEAPSNLAPRDGRQHYKQQYYYTPKHD